MSSVSGFVAWYWARSWSSLCAYPSNFPLALLEITVGLVGNNISEWIFHRYVQHGFGKRRDSIFGYHFYEHHWNARRNNYCDPDYRRSIFGLHAQGKEVLFLFLASLIPLLWAHDHPLLSLTNWAGSVAYYVLHSRSHLNGAEWARRWLPWHYDHHMGVVGDANYCVTFPLMDYILRTRVPYAGTQMERDHLQRCALRVAQTGQALDPVKGTYDDPDMDDTTISRSASKRDAGSCTTACKSDCSLHSTCKTTANGVSTGLLHNVNSAVTRQR